MVAILNFDLDWSKCKNDARNGLSMQHLVGKVVLHGLLYPFVFQVTFSIWLPVAILNFDVQTSQNMKMVS